MKGCGGMLTKEQYKALKKYRKSEIPLGENGLSEVEEYLLEQNYIDAAKVESCNYHGIIQFFDSAYRITELGKTALAEYEQKRRERLFQIFLVILGAVAALTAERIAALLFG